MLLDPSGRELKKIKEGAGADPVLDFTAPADGAYLLKLYDEVYGGGNDYFYRLTASAAPFVDFVFPPSGAAGLDESIHALRPQSAGRQAVPMGSPCRGVPLEKLPVNITLPADEAARSRLALSGFAPLARAWQDCIEYRLTTPAGPANPVSIYFAKAPAVVVEAEPNNCSGAGAKDRRALRAGGPVLSRARHGLGRVRRQEGPNACGSRPFRNQLGLASDPFLAIYRVKKNDKGAGAAHRNRPGR